MPQRAWTALFFLDEAVAIAAGHRPCNYCRRAAYQAWRASWERASGRPFDRIEMDKALHRARVRRDRSQIRFEARISDLPDHTFILWDGEPALVRSGMVIPYAPSGYRDPVVAVRRETVPVLTPRPSVGVLAQGYRPDVHPSVPV